jgi:hypothetical protein
MNYIFSIISILLIFSVALKAQTLEELRREQIESMQIAPNFMGPNALPVPDLSRGVQFNRRSLEMAYHGSFSNGDDTHSLYLNLDYTVVKDLISVFVYFNIYERFSMTESERIRRGIDSRFFESTGSEVGDVYYGFSLQLLKNRPKGPDLAVRGAVKTASGENVENGRYTDSPGYYFDLSLSRAFDLQEGAFIRPYLMLGFYSWQTYDVINPQNDAPIYGLGVLSAVSDWTFSAELTGYTGWKQNGDSPLVIRAEAVRSFGKIDARLAFEHGINDFQFTTAKVGVRYHINTL